MKSISKQFKTLKQAQNFQFKLYGKWNSVKLVQCPMYSESGCYVWNVSK